MTIKSKLKPKRVLKDIDFSGEDSHISFVGPAVGGPANLQDYTLVMKATSQFSEEFIEKMQQVKVTLELDNFLEIFFGLFEDDAAVLAAMMGYKEEPDTPEGEEGPEPAGTYQDDSFYEWYSDKCEKEGLKNEYGICPEPTTADHQEWIAMRLEGIEVLKSLKNSDSIAEVLSTLSESEYLGVLRDQERVEKALSKKESAMAAKAAKEAAVVAEKKKPKARVVKAEKKATQAEAGVVAKQPAPSDEAIPAVAADSKEVFKMTVKTLEVEKTEHVEMVEKAQYESIAKALEEQRVELEKASALIAQFQAEKKEAIAKARKAELVAAVEHEEKAEELFKAVGELSDEAFASVVGVVKSLSAKVDADPMFKEQGSPAEGEIVQKSALRAQLEAKYKK